MQIAPCRRLPMLAACLWLAACSGETPAPVAVAAEVPAAHAPAATAAAATGAQAHAAHPAAHSAGHSATAGAGDAAEGRRIATRVGCLGCHGKDLSGRELWGQKGKFQIRSSNITEHAAHYDDRGFERLLRTGATHGGQPALGMPVQMFQYLSDREVRDLTAFVRTLEPVPNPGLKPSWFTPAARKEIEAYGDHLGDPAKVAAPAEPPQETLALGRHIALTSCGECHGYDLNGFEGDSAPPLIVAKAYSDADFEKLMRTGKVPGGKETKSGLMSEVARDRFAPSLTSHEIAALKAFLDAR